MIMSLTMLDYITLLSIRPSPYTLNNNNNNNKKQETGRSGHKGMCSAQNGSAEKPGSLWLHLCWYLTTAVYSYNSESVNKAPLKCKYPVVFVYASTT